MRRAVSSYIGKASKDFGAEEEVIGAGGAAPVLSYSGLHLYEEAVLGFPLPLRERDRVRGKAVATHLLIQTKSAVDIGVESPFLSAMSIGLTVADPQVGQGHAHVSLPVSGMDQARAHSR